MGIADGAGGVAGGADAADAVCRALEHCDDDSPMGWERWLAELDVALTTSSRGGLAAAVVLEVHDDSRIAGASVGDCEAWIVDGDDARVLTRSQHRKPLLGDGGAKPVGFAGTLAGGTLVVATDGLWKYLPREGFRGAAARRPVEAAATALVEGVKLRNGALQDDVALVVAAWTDP